jgi:prepilin-type processing-associated H-X9-DG protein
MFRTHEFIANGAFVDGSVRSLAVSVSPEVLEALATIAGGEAVGNDF